MKKKCIRILKLSKPNMLVMFFFYVLLVALSMAIHIFYNLWHIVNNRLKKKLITQTLIV